MILGYISESEEKMHSITDQEIALEQYSINNKFVFDKIIKNIPNKNTYMQFSFNEICNDLHNGDIIITTSLQLLDKNIDKQISKLIKLQCRGIKIVLLDTPYLNDWKIIRDNDKYNIIINIYCNLNNHIKMEINKSLSINKDQNISKKNDELSRVNLIGKYNYKSPVGLVKMSRL